MVLGLQCLQVKPGGSAYVIVVRQTVEMKNLLSILLLAIISTACSSAAATDTQIGLPELIGTNWILTAIEGQPPIAGHMISLQISSEYFSGSAGCNRYSAKYTAKSPNSFLIDELEINEAACIEPTGIMEQENLYIERLSSAIKYQLIDQELILEDEQGQTILRYQPRREFEVTPNALVGKTWQLILAPELYKGNLGEFTIRFSESTFSGTTVCREYEGKYKVEEDNFQITFMNMTTDYNCDEENGLAEAQYTTLLENVEQYNVTLDQLELFTRHGEKLIFELVLDTR